MPTYRLIRCASCGELHRPDAPCRRRSAPIWRWLLGIAVVIALAVLVLMLAGFAPVQAGPTPPPLADTENVLPAPPGAHEIGLWCKHAAWRPVQTIECRRLGGYRGRR